MLVRFAAAVSVLLFGACSLSSGPDGTSIALVIVDTLRADAVGCYGGGVPTPNLDRIAAEGARFADATSQSPLTLPSHCSILTGTTPIYHGVRDNGRFRLPEPIDTLAEMLRRSGYETAAFVGALPVHSRFGLSQGFDTYDESFTGPVAERRAVEVVSAARRWVAERDGTPFFLWVHLFDPHAPYEPPEPFRSRYGDTYEGEVAYVDDALGPLLEALGENVLTVVTADHGESLGEHGEDTHALFIYDATLSVPLILRGPGVPSGVVLRAQARSIDITPTVLDLVGRRDACTACQGRSLVPAMKGLAFEPSVSYAETYFPRLNLGWSELRSVRRDGWKYIDAPEAELYHLTSDPKELENLAADEPEKLESLAEELSEISSSAAGPFQASPATIDRETVTALRSLGYASTQRASTTGGPLPDPKTRMGLWQGLQRAMDRVDRSGGEELDQAIVELQAILREDGGMLLARGYLSEAFFKRGRYEQAANECKKILSADPDDFQAAYLLGESFIRLGRFPEAEEALEEAASLDTRSAGPLARLANLRLRRGNVAGARQALDAALEREASDATVLLVQGKLLLAEGRSGEAEESLRRALASDPSEVATPVELANLLIAQKRFDEAEELLRESLARHPSSVDLQLTMGRARAVSGRPEEAIPAFQRAVELAPESTAAVNSLGFAHLEIGAVDRGVALLQRSLELDPDQPQIKSLLRRYVPR